MEGGRLLGASIGLLSGNTGSWPGAPRSPLPLSGPGGAGGLGGGREAVPAAAGGALDLSCPVFRFYFIFFQQSGGIQIICVKWLRLCNALQAALHICRPDARHQTPGSPTRGSLARDRVEVGCREGGRSTPKSTGKRGVTPSFTPEKAGVGGGSTSGCSLPIRGAQTGRGGAGGQGRGSVALVHSFWGFSPGGGSFSRPLRRRAYVRRPHRSWWPPEPAP